MLGFGPVVSEASWCATIIWPTHFRPVHLSQSGADENQIQHVYWDSSTELAAHAMGAINPTPITYHFFVQIAIIAHLLHSGKTVIFGLQDASASHTSG